MFSFYYSIHTPKPSHTIQCRSTPQKQNGYRADVSSILGCLTTLLARYMFHRFFLPMWTLPMALELPELTMSQLHCYQARWCPGWWPSSCGALHMKHFHFLIALFSVASLVPSSAASSSVGTFIFLPASLLCIALYLTTLEQLQARCPEACLSLQRAPRDALFVTAPPPRRDKIQKTSVDSPLTLPSQQTLTSRRRLSSLV